MSYSVHDIFVLKAQGFRFLNLEARHRPFTHPCQRSQRIPGGVRIIVFVKIHILRQIIDEVHPFFTCDAQFTYLRRRQPVYVKYTYRLISEAQDA